ncbi:hypothetical protein DXG01_016950 [Tephrocybe rancida]|nr:hypothetical protein DXG01_016950 [Tephrocybe rancida]
MDPNDPAMFTYPYWHHKLPIIEWQQQCMLEPPPIPHHYPQPQFASNVITEEDPRVLYQQRVKAHNVEQCTVLRMLHLSRGDFMAQA